MRLRSSAPALLLAACYSPSFDPCAVRCSTGDVCPGDTTCRPDGFCRADGEPACADATPLDAAVPDAPPDAMHTPPTVRWVRDAFFSSYSGTTFTSPGMSMTGFEIATDGVVDGELVVLVGSIDNGSNSVWPDPIAPGFTQLAQRFYGVDGQSFVVAWKIADGEPATYAGTYGLGIGSGSATITLIAASGVDPDEPVRQFLVTVDNGPATDPVVAASVGLVTASPDNAIVFAAGVDWSNHDGTNTFAPPDGYTQLAAIGDRGDATWDWTSQEVDVAIQPDPGATGALSSTFDGPYDGVAWSVVFAVAPPPL